MEINIVAGAPEIEASFLQTLSNHNVMWFGADRGVYHLLSAGIIPDEAFGDFDSVSDDELSWIKEKLAHTSMTVFPKEKDNTDLEIALEAALQKKPQLIRLIGVTGGRLDHTLVNIQLLVKGLQAGIRTIIISPKNSVELFQPGTHKVDAHSTHSYHSFLPFSEQVIGLTLKGFKYPLIDAMLTWGSTLSVSNELSEEIGTFSFTDGILMMIKSQD